MNAEGWRIEVVMLVGLDARVRVYDSLGTLRAVALMPSPAAAFGWGLTTVQHLTYMGRPEWRA